MLTEIVTRALSQLTGRPMSGELIKGQFQYAYASDDGQFVAILTHDMTTYVVDLSARRYFAECGGSPRDSPAMCWKWRDRPRAGIPGPPPTTCSTWTWTRTNWHGAIVGPALRWRGGRISGEPRRLTEWPEAAASA